MATIALVDDHRLLLNSMRLLISSFGHTVVFQAANGAELEQEIIKHPLPHIILLDINMPVKDGYSSAVWLQQHYPQVKVIALSMHNDELAIIRMLRYGAKGFLTKDCQPEELALAIEQVMTKDFYHSDIMTSTVLKGLPGVHATGALLNQLLQITQREETFISLCCSDLTYKEMAEHMQVSTRTIDSYRESVFNKLQVKSRSGLVTLAFKHRLVMV